MIQLGEGLTLKHFVIPKIIMSSNAKGVPEEVDLDCYGGTCGCLQTVFEKSNELDLQDGQNRCAFLGTSPEIRCSPSPCVFDTADGTSRRVSEGCLTPNRSSSRSASPGSESSPRMSRRGSSFRRSASPASVGSSRRGSSASTGYEQYQKSLLEVPISIDYGETSSDDLSSEWDSDVPEPPRIQLPKGCTVEMSAFLCMRRTYHLLRHTVLFDDVVDNEV